MAQRRSMPTPRRTLPACCRRSVPSPVSLATCPHLASLPPPGCPSGAREYTPSMRQTTRELTHRAPPGTHSPALPTLLRTPSQRPKGRNRAVRPSFFPLGLFASLLPTLHFIHPPPASCQSTKISHRSITGHHDHSLAQAQIRLTPCSIHPPNYTNVTISTSRINRATSWLAAQPTLLHYHTPPYGRATTVAVCTWTAWPRLPPSSPSCASTSPRVRAPPPPLQSTRITGASPVARCSVACAPSPSAITSPPTGSRTHGGSPPSRGTDEAPLIRASLPPPARTRARSTAPPADRDMSSRSSNRRRLKTPFLQITPYLSFYSLYCALSLALLADNPLNPTDRIDRHTRSSARKGRFRSDHDHWHRRADSGQVMIVW